MLTQRGVEPTDQLGEERVGHIRDHHAHGPRPLGGKAARQMIRVVVEVGSGLGNASAYILAHGPRPVEHMGDRGDGNPGGACNLTNVSHGRHWPGYMWLTCSRNYLAEVLKAEASPP